MVSLMGLKKVKKQDGTTVVVETGKGGKGIVTNLGSEQARAGVQGLGDVPKADMSSASGDAGVSVDDRFAQFKDAHEDVSGVESTEYVVVNGVLIDPNQSERLAKEEAKEDLTVVDEGLNKRGKILDRVGRGVIAAGFVGGITSVMFLGPIAFLPIALGGAGLGAGLSAYGIKLRRKAGADIAPEGKFSDLWKKEDV